MDTDPVFVIKCLRAYDPIADDLATSLDELGIAYSRTKCEVMHYGRDGGHHYNDKFEIPFLPSKSLREWFTKAMEKMFGAHLELTIEDGDKRVSVKGRTYEEIEKMVSLARTIKSSESTRNFPMPQDAKMQMLMYVGLTDVEEDKLSAIDSQISGELIAAGITSRSAWTVENINNIRQAVLKTSGQSPMTIAAMSCSEISETAVPALLAIISHRIRHFQPHA